MGSIQIKVRTTEGNTFTLDVRTTYTILDVKKMIQEQEGIRYQEHKLVFEGYPLWDYNILWYYGITNGSTLLLRQAIAIPMLAETEAELALA